MRPLQPRLALLSVLALAVLVLASSEAAAQTAAPPAIKFPAGDAFPAPGMPGTFLVNAGDTIRWVVVFDNSTGFIPLAITYTDVMDPLGVATCGPTGQLCPGAEDLELLCDPGPDGPDPGPGGAVDTCDPATGTLILTNINVNPGSFYCIEFSTKVSAAAAGVVSNIGCISERTSGQQSATTPTTDAAPTCRAGLGAAMLPACSQVQITTVAPPDFGAIKTATPNDEDGDGVTEIGETITWTVDVTNNGTDPADAWMFDDMPAGSTFVDFVDDLGGACGFRPAEGRIACPMVNFAAGETKSFSFRTEVDCGAATDDDSFQVCNQARICNDAAGLDCSLSDADGALPVTPTCVDFPFTNYTASTKQATVEDVDGDGTVNTGDRVTYTITVLNDGRADGTNVQVVDQLSSGCMQLPPFDDGGGTYDPGSEQLTFDVGTVPAGEMREVSFTVAVIDGAGPECCNQAEIRSQERDACGLGGIPTDNPATPAPDDPTCVPFGPQPFPAVTKAIELTDDVNGNGLVDDGDTVLFTIELTNTGGAAATNVVIDDPLAPCWGGFDPPTVTIVGGGTNDSTPPVPPGSGGRVLVSAAGGPDGLTPGETVTVTFEVFYRDLIGNCCNQATVTYDEATGGVVSDNPGTGAPNDPTCSDSVGAGALLAVTKTAIEADPDGCLQPGERVTWQVLVEVTGGGATALQLRDVIADPALVTFVSSPDGTFNGSDAVNWDIGDVADGFNQVFEWTGQIACDAVDGAALSDTATATAADAAAASDTWQEDVDAPVLVVTKDESPVGSVAPDGTVTFTITIDNTGGCRASNAVLADQLDADLDWATVTAVPAPTANDGTGGLSWDLGDIAVGPPVVVTVTATALDPGTNPQPGPDGLVENFASVTAENPDPTSCPGVPPLMERGASNPIAIEAQGLRVSKSVTDGDGDGCLEPGETLTWTIDVTAVGMPATGVGLVDTITDAAGVLTVVEPVADGGVYDAGAGTITWALGDIAMDATVSRVYETTVDCAATDGTALENEAVATDAAGGLTGRDTWTGQVNLAVLQVTKTVVRPAGPNVPVGGMVVFEILVENVGSCAADQVMVADQLDADLDWTAVATNPVAADDGTGGLSWDLGDLAAGASTTLTVDTTATGGADDVIDNTAVATSNNPDPARCDPATYPPVMDSGAASTVTVGGGGGGNLLSNAEVTSLTGGAGDCGLNTTPNESTVLTTPCDMPFLDPSNPVPARIGNPVDRGPIGPGMPVTLVGEAEAGFEAGVLVFYAFDGGQTLRIDKSGADLIASVP